ncbi:unnamed protein product [Rhizophagus irregularis]|uniref:Uncharacterized protein n=1 Tax=Rhizophagus irregularis TaxID=588596 RepID=A0A916E7S9_9GLOM|nr:unnamed protein product [Rhizophagus irregularis]
MYQVLNIRPHPSFRFIHEEHTSSKSSYSVVTNARGIYLIVVIVVAPSDSQRVIKRQQGLMDAKQLKEQFRLANINNEKNDEAIARAADENYLVNKQVIDEVYLEASRPVMDIQEEMLQQGLRSIGCYDDVVIDDCENLVIEELSEEEMMNNLQINNKHLTTNLYYILWFKSWY